MSQLLINGVTGVTGLTGHNFRIARDTNRIRSRAVSAIVMVSSTVKEGLGSIENHALIVWTLSPLVERLT